MDQNYDPVDIIDVECPYCGEVVETSFERDVAGEMVIDCEICCRPWRVISRRDASGRRLVTVEREA